MSPTVRSAPQPKSSTSVMRGPKWTRSRRPITELASIGLWRHDPGDSWISSKPAQWPPHFSRPSQGRPALSSRAEEREGAPCSASTVSVFSGPDAAAGPFPNRLQLWLSRKSSQSRRMSHRVRPAGYLACATRAYRRRLYIVKTNSPPSRRLSRSASGMETRPSPAVRTTTPLSTLTTGLARF